MRNRHRSAFQLSYLPITTCCGIATAQRFNCLIYPSTTSTKPLFSPRQQMFEFGSTPGGPVDRGSHSLRSSTA